jgi:hypothetical protein
MAAAFEISHAIQSWPLFTAVRQSEIFYPAVLATHLTCIAIFGGMILATNLRLLGLAFTSMPTASLIDSTRMWKRGGFCLMISCGILLAGSKLDQYYANPFLQMKLSLLCAIGLHGTIFRKSVYRNPKPGPVGPGWQVQSPWCFGSAWSLAAAGSPTTTSTLNTHSRHEAPVSARDFLHHKQPRMLRQQPAECLR